MCVFCKQPAQHMAHIEVTGLNGAGRGAKNRYLDVIRNPTKYRAMCVECHRTFDALVSVAVKSKIEAQQKEQPIPF